MIRLLLGQSDFFFIISSSLEEGLQGCIMPESLSRADSASYKLLQCHCGMFTNHEDNPCSRIGINVMDFGSNRRPGIGVCIKEDWDCVGRCIHH